MSKKWPRESGVIRELNGGGFVLNDDSEVLGARNGSQR